VHHHDEATAALTEAIVRYAVERVRLEPPPLDRPLPASEIRARVGRTISPSGIGGQRALELFTDVLGPACISVDHPRFFAFVPAAPTEASILFDLVVGASSVYAGSWLEGAGAVFAENEALAWISSLAGLPAGSGGVFVSGGTAGNLSALIAARWQWRREAEGRHDRTRGLLIASSGAHSSVAQAARAMDADIVEVPADGRGRLGREALAAVITSLEAVDRDRVFAVVATAGTTNVGVVDDLCAAADAASSLRTWFHVDGAYGGAALAAPSVRHLFEGVERADSFIVDPHKWLFAPFDACALVYRTPAVARAAHSQHAAYLEPLRERGEPEDAWDPADYAHHLSRRARGLPLWFSLATHGTDAYTEAVETTLTVTRAAAALIDASPHTELVLSPELSILVFRRVGWAADAYREWCDRLLADGIAFVTPTVWQGETVLRLCIVNPLTTVDDIRTVVDSLK
jgi:L-2,4-diaminobutyrate decarboxylase